MTEQTKTEKIPHLVEKLTSTVVSSIGAGALVSGAVHSLINGNQTSFYIEGVLGAIFCYGTYIGARQIYYNNQGRDITEEKEQKKERLREINELESKVLFSSRTDTWGKIDSSGVLDLARKVKTWSAVHNSSDSLGEVIYSGQVGDNVRVDIIQRGVLRKKWDLSAVSDNLEIGMYFWGHSKGGDELVRSIYQSAQESWLQQLNTKKAEQEKKESQAIERVRKIIK